MKNIRFKEILLLSYSEKKAKRISLNSDVVVIKGGNGTGKSCLLKSLYGVFGAQVNKYPEGWNPQLIVTLLKFQIDGINMAAMRIGRDFYLLNPDNSYFSETDDLEKHCEKLSQLFGLNLYYYSEQSKKKRLPVGCFFMPFYIDQDFGWQQPWTSFTQVGNEQVKHNLMLYLTGVINYDYYNFQSHLNALRSEARRWRSERITQNNFIKIIKDKLQSKTISLTEEDFEGEIKTFVEKLQELKDQQNKLLKCLEELHFDKMFKESRIATLHANIREIEQDFKYAIQHEDSLMCPVCGAKTDNTALARLGMNIDKEESRELIIKYNIELADIDKKIGAAAGKVSYIKDQIDEIESLVTTKKEEYTLKEYLDNKVVEKIYSIFSENEREFDENINRVETEQKDEEDKIKNLKGTNRLKVILEDFNKTLATYSSELGSSLDRKKHHDLGEKIKGSGSSHPKETLAYFYSYLYIMQKYSTPIMLPIVIDEFKQNGTTNQSIGKIIDFAIKNKPKNGQLIYSVSEDYPDSAEGVRVVALTGDRLMNENEYNSVREEIDEILNKNFYLKGQ